MDCDEEKLQGIAVGDEFVQKNLLIAI